MTETRLPHHLERGDRETFCVTRKKWGRGYQFFLEDEQIEDDQQLELLKNIPVPDTWSEVKLCLNPKAHILAIGYDGSSKLQYLYHPDFLQFRNLQKFESLSSFGLALPRIRRKLRNDIKSETWSEKRLLALMVRILDKHYLRIGSRIYARSNNSFGLTTLRKKHLKETESNLKFEYTGKSGQARKISLSDPALVNLVEELSDFSGWELFSFYHGGERVKADAKKVNAYIRDISGGDFSARDFRTWAGTVLSLKYHNSAKKILKENPRRKLKSIIVELVAERLGNTTSICEEYYIHPQVLAETQNTDFNPEPTDEQLLRKSLLRKYECRALEILNC